MKVEILAEEELIPKTVLRKSIIPYLKAQLVPQYHQQKNTMN